MRTFDSTFMTALAASLALGASALAASDEATRSSTRQAADYTKQTGADNSGTAIGSTRLQDGRTVQEADGIVRHQGDVYLQKNGQRIKVQNEMQLSEGITARPNGRITTKDGKSVDLQDGQLMTFDGQVVSAMPRSSQPQSEKVGQGAGISTTTGPGALNHPPAGAASAGGASGQSSTTLSGGANRGGKSDAADGAATSGAQVAPPRDASSASGLTTPGASSGSSLGSGSNSTTGGNKGAASPSEGRSPASATGASKSGTAQ